MSKKLIITLSVVFSVIAVLLILFWTLFALSSVTVNFKSTTENLSISNEEIVEAGEFRYGSCVLFEGKQKSIKKIYAHASENENFAYLRVLNIETVFPNKFVLHVVEREELFAVEYGDQFLICDRDFRVLKMQDTFSSTQTNAILLAGVNVESSNVAVGDFLKIKQSAMLKFYSIMLKNNRDFGQLIGKYEKMGLSSYADELTKKEYTALTMTSFQGRKFVINNIDFAFLNKVQKLFATESAFYNQKTDSDGNFLNSDGQFIYVVKTAKGEYVSYENVKDMKDDDGNLIYDEADKKPLSFEIFKNCYIKVDNLTLNNYIKRTEKDIYYSLVENI